MEGTLPPPATVSYHISLALSLALALRVFLTPQQDAQLAEIAALVTECGSDVVFNDVIYHQASPQFPLLLAVARGDVRVFNALVEAGC